MSGAAVRLLADGRRLHLQHGPIDIIAEAFGGEEERARGYGQATRRFESILDELVAELPRLRERVGRFPPKVRGAIARRMVDAVWPHRAVFVTPMAAVAGAVADEVLAHMVDGCDLARAYVNDGGDVAVHLTPGESFRIAVVDRLDAPEPSERIELRADRPARGLATSGWRGRSLSLGIADAVTALARDAAAADAAATLIANAVDCAHPSIRRLPASHLREDSDLGDLPATVEVGDLPAASVAEALARGAASAEAMRQRGLIQGARLALQGQVRRVGLESPEKGSKAAP